MATSTSEAKEHLTRVVKCKGYTIKGVVGKGGSATCYAVQSNTSQHMFVCKQMVIDKNTPCSDCEIRALKSLHAPNIISLYDFYVEHPYVYLFLELCPNGSLSDYINKHGPIKGDKLVSLMHSLLTGLAYIHGQNCAHLDIKPGNILFDSHWRPKLADFGISRFADHGESNQHAGTIAFMAPEILQGRAYNQFKADIWALGITFYWMCKGKSPWGSATLADVKEMIPSGPGSLTSPFPTEVCKLINSMCRVSPAARPSAEELLAYPVFDNLKTDERKRIVGRRHASEKGQQQGRPRALMSAAMNLVMPGVRRLQNPSYISSSQSTQVFSQSPSAQGLIPSQTVLAFEPGKGVSKTSGSEVFSE